MRPTRLDPVASMVSGKLPGTTGATSYYIETELSAGNLVTQLQVVARDHERRRLTLELLNDQAERADSVSITEGFADKDETTKAFAINHSGRYVLRLTADGVENGTFCVVFGGSALSQANPPGCPAPQTAKVASEPEPEPAPEPKAEPELAAPPKAVEVIVSKCEERLRVDSDFLFDFDRAELRPAADKALMELSQRITAAHKRATVEGHTDSLGTESYNQRLSERRAYAVRVALLSRGAFDQNLVVRGFGKSRPIAPNQNFDGSDNPEGRQKNRRVEVVMNTCE
jgi:outer membrane protein OmpA-like peptidoglycan-associated protein